MDWNLFKKFWKRQKLESFRRTLIYLIKNEDKVELSEIKEREKDNFSFVKKILNHADYCNILKIIESKKEKEFCEITNYNKLLDKIQSLNSIRDDKFHKNIMVLLGLYSLLITFLFVGISIMQFNSEINVYNKEIYYSKLNHISQLDLVDYKFKNFSDNSSLELEFCFLNRGGINSGEINIKIFGEGIIERNQKLSNIKSKNNFCSNLSLGEINMKNYPFEFGFEYDCLNCEKKISENLVFDLA